jgi:hypothetical protein
MRLLGYTDSDVGMSWPDGYLAVAAEIGLTASLSLSSASALTRAQAALLFSNLLATELKSGGYYVTKLSGSAVEGAILLSSEDDDGNIVTSSGTYTPAVAFSADLVASAASSSSISRVRPSRLFPEAKTSVRPSPSPPPPTVPSRRWTHTLCRRRRHPGIQRRDLHDLREPLDRLAPGNRVSLYYNKAGKLAAVFCHTGSNAGANGGE